MTDDLALLCRSCGLCCDGSLFGRVPLDGDEREAARKHRLRLVATGAAFEQPCSALVSAVAHGAREHLCAIYDERPRACRRFACRFYERHQRDGGPIEVRIDRVRHVRRLVADLEASGLLPADFEAIERGAHTSPAVAAALTAYRELVEALEDDFSRANGASRGNGHADIPPRD